MSFNYYSGFTWNEAIIKGAKKCYIEGYISTIDKDDYNEIVDMTGQNKILSEVKGKIITMDFEHEEFLNENNKVLDKPKNTRIPVAKIVEAELRSKGVWVKAEINQDSERFKNVWGSIKNGFLHSFSIAFVPLKAITKKVGDTVERIISDLNLINVTLTGSPVNTNATFTPVMKAAIKSMEGNNMENNEEQKTEEPKEQPKESEQKEEVKSTATVEDLINAAKNLEKEKQEFDAEKEKFAQEKQAFEQQKTQAAETPAEPVVDETPLSSIKSLKGQIEKYEKEIADLKAKLATPIFKSTIKPVEEAKSEAEKRVVGDIKGPLDVL